MRPLQPLILASFALLGAEARTGHGFVGIGIYNFDPKCAFACRDAISGATLNCSVVHSAHDMHGMNMAMSGMGGGGSGVMVMTDPDCYATDEAFLTTLAWCISTRCNDTSIADLERYWQTFAVGSDDVQRSPEHTYSESLAMVNGTPNVAYESGSLNQTSVVPYDTWWPSFYTSRVFWDQESQQVRYGFVLMLSGVVIPIAFSLLRFIPFPSAWRSKFNAYIVDPPAFGSRTHDYSSSAILRLGHMPTRGQTLFICYLIVVNTVLSAVNYELADPNNWFPDDGRRWMEMLVSNRLGLLSFANMPLVFLYAGRNNLLLWITDWSHSTFLLLHRWIAAISTLQAILHSLIYLVVYARAGTHNAEAQKPYWYWGIIATLGMTLMFPLSARPIRRKVYELFLAWHVAISILVVAGCYWHIVFRYSHKWGYETWIVMCMAIWAFDRVFRVARLLRHGVRRAVITPIDGDYVRVTVPDLSVSGHAYLYFPTVTWRVWENHPFSAAASFVPAGSSSSSSSFSNISSDKQPQSADKAEVAGIHTSSAPVEGSDSEAQCSPPGRHAVVAEPGKAHEAGTVFYIRCQAGLTSSLRNHRSVPVLVEAGYSSHSFISSEPAGRKSPRLLAIAGGVGISAVLPALRSHAGTSRLYWGCRSHALVDDVRRAGLLSHVDADVTVGRRMSIREILETELVHGPRVEVCVLACGPNEMADEVWNVLAEIVRAHQVKANLVVESFSW